MNPKRYRKPQLPLLLLAIGAAIGLPTAGMVAAKLTTEPTDHPATAPALAVSTLVVETADGYALRRVFTGQVEANRVSNLGFERGGLLLQVLVREGEPIAAGQVIARLDTALLESRRRELEAALSDVLANQSLAAATLHRYHESVGDGAVTRQALDEAREGERAARAGVDLAMARISSIDLDIAKSELRAPFDGIVTGRLADEGRVLSAGTAVLELQERAVPEIRVGIAGVLAETLRPGIEYPLTWRGRSFTARLRAVLPLRRLATRTQDALFVPTEPPSGLGAGDLVELELSQWINESGIWLPLSALAAGTRGLWQTYAAEPLALPVHSALEADHRIVPKPVEVLYQEDDRVFVRGPLGSSERIVQTGLQRVVPGQLVRVLVAVPDSIAMESQ